MLNASGADAHAGGYTTVQRRIELAGITVFFSLFIWTLARIFIFAYFCDLKNIGLIAALSILCGYLFSDFISGFVHWAADNWGDPDWAFWGPGFIRPFRHHHVAPREISEHGFIELNGNNCLIALPTFLPAFFLSPEEQSLRLFAFSAFTSSLAFFVFLTNQAHAWAHAVKPPALARLAQRCGFILSPKHHAVHHQEPHNNHYCITSGWMDYPLKWLRFFKIVELIMTRLSGTLPQHELGRRRREGGS